MKKGLIILIVILIAAAISKPSKDSFSDYINTTLKVNKNEDLISSIVKTGMNFQSDLSTQYKDRLFFSTAKTFIGNRNYSYLGLFGFWFKIE